MFMFRGDAPRKEMEAILPTPQRIGFKLFGRALFKEYPFEEAYFLPMARQFRESLSLPLILLGGINTVESIHQAMAEGFEFVAMGRALLRDPELVNKMQRRYGDSGKLHPLQQVHGQHLHGYPLRHRPPEAAQDPLRRSRICMIRRRRVETSNAGDARK